jgi:serine/threonine protein phosphatase 1
MISRQQNDDQSAPPRVPEGRRVYAMGDIHGRDDLLRRLHRRIGEDAAQATNGADGNELAKVVVYLGDYVDRGPGSFEVVDLLLGTPLEGFEAIHLKGNHEDFLLRFWEDGSLGEAWLMNGGLETLRSHGVEVLDLDLGLAGDALAEVRRRLRQALPSEHLDFFRGLARWHVEGDYLFVHAGLRPGVPLDRQKDQDLFWIRHKFLDSGADFGKIVVHGHTISPEADMAPNRIGIDTGAYYSGRLTCLVLEGATRRFIHT